MKSDNLIKENKKNDTNRVSKIITLYKGKILLLQKNNGMFELPGGHIEYGESPLNGAIREFYEETKLDVTRLKQLTANSRRVLFRGSISSRNVIISDEHKSFIFIHKKDISRMPLNKWTRRDLSFLTTKKTITDSDLEEIDAISD